MMNDLTTLGIIALVFAFLALLAGAGFWRLVIALVAAALLAAGAAAGVGWVVWRIANSFTTGGGEWRGLGPLVIGVITTGVVFLGGFVVTMIVIGVTKRGIFRRSPASRIALGMGALLFAGGVGAFVLDTPAHAPTALLVRKLGNGAASGADEQELVRRGSAVVPALVAELHRHPCSRADHYAPSQVPPQLRVLGQLGGAEATAELRRWAEADVDASIRVAAVTALAAQGDRSAEPWIVQFLAQTDGQWQWQRPQLLTALGQLKAAGQVGTIRDVVAQQASHTPPQLVPEGVAALVAIGTAEAWAAIAELSAHPEESRRIEVLTALQNHPGPRTVAVLAKALEDREATVRESAFWALRRAAPGLAGDVPSDWSEANGQKLRAAAAKRPGKTE